ncbi:MAG: DUF1294 domain-containing protein [Candidatus Sumerlaeaceae bacterium]|nr:DUF1294 domain-containing protein [Candidatus Sumerlaeaceae bacterium]
MPQPTATRYEGYLETWIEEKGYGFIQRDDNGRDVFIFHSAFPRRLDRIEIGMRISFEIEQDDQGRPRATNVRLPGWEPEPLPPPNRRQQPYQSGFNGPAPGGFASWAVLLAFVAISFAGFASGYIPWQILAFYLGASVVCYLTYAGDKAAAEEKAWRTPEKTLHALSLVGGWPGAIMAQQTLRHKTVKEEFRIVFWMTVILNTVGLTYLLSNLPEEMRARNKFVGVSQAESSGDVSIWTEPSSRAEASEPVGAVRTPTLSFVRPQQNTSVATPTPRPTWSPNWDKVETPPTVAPDAPEVSINKPSAESRAVPKTPPRRASKPVVRKTPDPSRPY